jgi:hypothetical protein
LFIQMPFKVSTVFVPWLEQALLVQVWIVPDAPATLLAALDELSAFSISGAASSSGGGQVNTQPDDPVGPDGPDGPDAPDGPDGPDGPVHGDVEWPT